MWPPESGLGQLLDYHPGFLDDAEATALLNRLWSDLHWSQPEIRMFGRTMKQPRLVAYHGDPGAVYAYSGTRLEPRAWRGGLGELRQRVEACSGLRFNAVLVNAYRDGRDSMGWHADDEKELGPRPAIASLSLGAARRFRLRRRGEGPAGRSPSLGLVLEHGSLLVMKPGCQEAFQHALPRTRQPVGLRLNLTWRQVQLQTPD